MADLAHIHNLGDLALWAGGSPAKPRFSWVYTDPDSQNSSKYRVRIYGGASGGTNLCPDGEVSSVVASGATMTHDCTYGMALGDGPIFTNLIQNGSSTDANNYVTASVTLRAGRLYILSVENSKGSATADVISSVTGGAGVPTFVSRSSVAYNSGLNRESIWTAVPTADYTGTLTINFGGVTQTGAIWSVDEARGIDTTTNHGVVQQATGTGNSGTALATLGALAFAENPTFGAAGHAAATASAPGSGLSELSDQTQATPAQAQSTNYVLAGDTTMDATFTSAQWGACAIELSTAERWWTVEVWDSVGESSGESARTSFKVLWGQGLYEFNPGSSSAWQFGSGSVAANTQAAFAFRGATSAGGDAASGKTSFFSQIGQVPLAGITWLQVLVRIATTNSTTQPALPDMTFSYLGSALVPDRWTLSPGAEWALDESVRRYGSRALKCAVQSGTAGDRTAYPFRVVDGDDVPVTPSTTYTWSVFVRTNGALTGGNLKLEVWTAGGGALLASSTPAITDTSAEPDKWQRISVTATTGAGDTFVRPILRYTRNSGVTETFWMDAMAQEEGTVATTWRPGGIGKAVVVDVSGIVVDGVAGGIFRVRTSGGTQIEAGPAGLLIAATAAADDIIASRVIGDAGPRFSVDADGNIRVFAAPNDANPSVQLSTAGLGFGPGGGTAILSRLRGAGTAFPGSPATDDLFHRTDRDLEYFYDGTRWLSKTLYTLTGGLTFGTWPMAATGTQILMPVPFAGITDLWLENAYASFFVGGGGTALGASHKWVLTANKNGLTLIATINIDSGSSAVWRASAAAAIGALVGTSNVEIDWVATKTGTPGTLYFIPTITYRLLG